MSFNIVQGFRNINPAELHNIQEKILPHIENSTYAEETWDVQAYISQKKQEKKDFNNVLKQNSYNLETIHSSEDFEKIGIRLTHNEAIEKVIQYLWDKNQIVDDPETFVGAFYNKRTESMTVMFFDNSRNIHNPANLHLSLQKLGSASNRLLQTEVSDTHVKFEDAERIIDETGTSYIQHTKVQFMYKDEDISELSVNTSIELGGEYFVRDRFCDTKLKTEIIKELFEKNDDLVFIKKHVTKTLLDHNSIVTSQDIKS